LPGYVRIVGYPNVAVWSFRHREPPIVEAIFCPQAGDVNGPVLGAGLAEAVIGIGLAQ
jgi:hypothetical protein